MRPLSSSKKFVSESQAVKSFGNIGDLDELSLFLTGIGDISSVSLSIVHFSRGSVGSVIEPTATSKGSVKGCKIQPVEARLLALLALLTLGLLFDGAGAVGPAFLGPG